jgi:hypothetical protein
MAKKGVGFGTNLYEKNPALENPADFPNVA